MGRNQDRKQRKYQQNNLKYLNSDFWIDQRRFDWLRSWANKFRYRPPSNPIRQRSFNSSPGKIDPDTLQPEYRKLYDKGLLKI